MACRRIGCDSVLPHALGSSRVYRFDDTVRGSCRVPEAWHLEVETPDGWKVVDVLKGSAYGVGRDAFQEVLFEQSETEAVRLVVELQEGVSAGVLEWEVGP